MLNYQRVNRLPHNPTLWTSRKSLLDTALEYSNHLSDFGWLQIVSWWPDMDFEGSKLARCWCLKNPWTVGQSTPPATRQGGPALESPERWRSSRWSNPCSLKSCHDRIYKLCWLIGNLGGKPQNSDMKFELKIGTPPSQLVVCCCWIDVMASSCCLVAALVPADFRVAIRRRGVVITWSMYTCRKDAGAVFLTI